MREYNSPNKKRGLEDKVIDRFRIVDNKKTNLILFVVICFFAAAGFFILLQAIWALFAGDPILCV